MRGQFADGGWSDLHEEFFGEGAGDHSLDHMADVEQAGFLTCLVVALGVRLVRVLQGHVIASKAHDHCSGVDVELIECCSLPGAGGRGDISPFVSVGQ